MIKLIFFLGMLGSMFMVQGQENIPIIRANTKDVSVRDGEHFRKGYWYIMPEVSPDYYHVENPKKPHRVSFYTDLDSIAFDVTVNNDYDFIILLNGKDSCLTRVSTKTPKPLVLKRSCVDCNIGSDTIPFTMGLDNKIYVKAKINNGKAMRFLFDLGSTNCVINESIAEKSKIKWEGNATMGSVQGSETVKVSKHNAVQVKSLQWDSVPLFSTQHIGWGTKGILGMALLQEQIIELNYDEKIIVIHQERPDITKGYHKVDMEMRDGVPYIPITIDNGKTKATNWYMFDNGYSDCLLVDNMHAKANGLYGSMRNLGFRDNDMNGHTETVAAPVLRMGNLELTNVPIDLQNPADPQPYDRVIAGNDLLKRLNVIIDFRESVIYVKPNSLMNEPYDKASIWLQRILWAAGILLLVVVYLLVKRRLRSKKQSTLGL